MIGGDCVMQFLHFSFDKTGKQTFLKLLKRVAVAAHLAI